MGFVAMGAGVAAGAVTVGEGVLTVAEGAAAARSGWLTVSSGIAVAAAFAACFRDRVDGRVVRVADSSVVGTLSEDVLTLALGTAVGSAGAAGATTGSGVVVTGAAGAGVLTVALGGAAGGMAVSGVVATGAAGAAAGALGGGEGATTVSGGVATWAAGAGAAAAGAVFDWSVLLFATGFCASPSATSKAGRTISRNTFFMQSSKECRLAAV